MARIPEEEIERLKREVSVERLAEARGVKLKRHGADLIGLCPFHEDREPSLVISPDKNLWHCLGACQAGGSVIDWVMKAEGVSFRHAAELLRNDYFSLAATSEPATTNRPPATSRKYSTVRKLEVFVELDEPDAVVLGRVVDYYHATLKESPAAMGYLRERGLIHGELIDHFRLGYADRTLGYRLPEKNRKAGEASRGQLQRLGIFRDSGHEHLSGSVVIPILGEDGVVLGMYGRKITPNLRKGTPLHLYLPGPHRGIFNVQALRASKEIILCESLIDALTFWCAGFRNVTSAYGVEGFTDELREAFRKYGVDRVLIAYDRDAAGEKAAEKLGAELGAGGIEALRVVFPHGMDANEYALKVKPADQSLGVALRAARWLAGPSRRLRNVGDKVTPPEVLELYQQRAREPETASDSGAAPEPIFPLAAELPEPNMPAPPASASQAVEIGAEVKDDETVIRFGDRKWRIRGLGKNLSYESLKVNVLVARGDAFFVDMLELYSARQRAAFIKQAAEELGIEERILKSDLGKVVLKLEELQHKLIDKALEPSKKPVELSEQDRERALGLLRDPNLLERILEDFESCGVVGEENNKLIGYIAAVSRKLDEPLAIVIQSSSAAGKSSLMEAILAFIPEEERVHYSAMTGQSLFYMGEMDLQHKILAIAEEHGAHNASYALKLLQSEGELTIASTGKDPATGRLVTHEYRVQGPVMIFLTTTAIEVDEELLSRCIVLTVDEGREQTRAIHELQRRGQTLEGLLQRQDRGQLLKLHQDAQRLLMPLFVANPFANELTFLDHQTRTRRDHMKYLTLIRAIALLHQYQRPVKTAQHRGAEVRYVEVTRQDIRTANRLADEVLGRSLDELPPQTRKLLGLIDQMVNHLANQGGHDRKEVRFTRREVREYTGWRHTQLKVHLGRLEELEYLQVHAGGARQRMVYELVVSAEQVVAASRGDFYMYDANWSGSGRGLVAPPPRPDLSNDSEEKAKLVGVNAKAHIRTQAKNTSYRSDISPLAADSGSVATV